MINTVERECWDATGIYRCLLSEWKSNINLLHSAASLNYAAGEPREAPEHSYPQPLRPGSTAGAMCLRETDYGDIIILDYRKKSAVRTASENLIQEESHADGKDKDEHFATLESSCDPKRKPLPPYLGSPTLVWESTL